MAETTPPSREVQFAERIERLGLYASIMGAVILVAVILGNLYIIPFKHADTAWLLLVVHQGPVVCGLIGILGTASTFYGRGRIVLRKKKYDVRDDLTDQALDAPSKLQDLPNRLGCTSALGPGVLAMSLLLLVLTFGPSPLGVLGNGINAANIGVGTATPIPSQTAVAVVPTATSRPTATLVPTATEIPPTATSVPTAMPTVVKFTAKLAPITQYCSQGIGPITVTLDNSGSNVAVEWQISITDTYNNANNMPTIWAQASTSKGIIAAGQSQTLTLMVNSDFCVSSINKPAQTFHATVTLTKGGASSTVLAETLYPQQLT